MRRWPRIFTVALVCFVVASGFAAHAFWVRTGETRQYIYTAQPLPVPGSSTKFWFRTSRYNQRYALGLTVNATPNKAGRYTHMKSPDCDIEARFYDRTQGLDKLKGETVHTVRFERNAQHGSSGQNSVTFTTDVLDFVNEDYDVEVSNLGCDANYQFTGGVLKMISYQRGIFSRASFTTLAAIAFGSLAMLASLIGSAMLLVKRFRSRVPSSGL